MSKLHPALIITYGDYNWKQLVHDGTLCLLAMNELKNYIDHYKRLKTGKKKDRSERNAAHFYLSSANESNQNLSAG